MGLFEFDDRNLYKNNILDIPKDKLQNVPSNNTGNTVAINQGVVQLRCFIHPYCPFVKIPREEYALAFNQTTMPIIVKEYGDYVKNSLSFTQGVEGIHFLEKYNYRHNYAVIPDLTSTGLGTEAYTPIAQINRNSINETRYKEEQTWIVRESMFDYLLEDVDTEASTFFKKSCKEGTSWMYSYPKINNSYNDIDVLHDFKKDYYLNNSKKINSNNNGIDTSYAQFVKPSSIQDCLGAGSHWRVEKKTPLFRGEDFFIEFQKLAKNTVNNSEENKFRSFRHSFVEYAPIDVIGDIWSTNGRFDIETPNGDIIDTIYINNAVQNGDSKEDRLVYSLFDQAYYVLEIGDPSQKMHDSLEHYFIIITERGYPIFIMIDEFEGFVYSRILSKYDSSFGGVHGSYLISSDILRITVRNHLGKLVILFDINGQRQTPWVVSKEDHQIFNKIKKDADSGNKDDKIDQTTNKALVVPNARIQLWGGNIPTSFCFGPLQYNADNIFFKWPQKFSLPMDIERKTKISARLTSSDEYIEDLVRYEDIPEKSQEDVPLFTQQCHFYRQWGDSSKFGSLNVWERGAFYFGLGGSPMIELSEDNYPGIRDAKISMEALTVMNSGRLITQSPRTVDYDEARRLANFYLYVSLDTGSHLFEGFGGGKVIGWRDVASYVTPNPSNLQDDKWVIEACKTPIMTGVRLVTEELSEETRWEDKTIVKDPITGEYNSRGYNGLPNPDNPYFRDVSHHALSYSENWTASDFFEIEHSGTIQFLLKEINIATDGLGGGVTFNDSDYLINLRDKNFFIEIWAGYTPLRNGEEYTQLGGFYKLMTGICQGGTLDTTTTRTVMICEVKDYKEILKDQKFFNSPFFDGMRDVNAVNEIMNMAGFRSTTPYEPGSLIKTIKDNDLSGTLLYSLDDGRFFNYTHYSLPSSYNRIEQAYFKFDAGTSLYEGIVKITQNASKLFYFDQHGVAHFENYFDLIQQSLINNTTFETLFDFTSNYFLHDGQLIYNKVEKSYRQEDVHNHLKIISSTPNGEVLIADDLRYEAFEQPNVEGFVGYDKLFYQKEGMLGSTGAVKKIMEFYKVMFRPEIAIKFETHGIPLRATDFISIDGQFFRTTKVSHEISAQENKWWMNVEGERLQYPQ